MPYQECKEGYNSHHKQASHCIGRGNGNNEFAHTKSHPFKNKQNIINTIRGQPHGCPRTSIK